MNKINRNFYTKDMLIKARNYVNSNIDMRIVMNKLNIQFVEEGNNIKVFDTIEAHKDNNSTVVFKGNNGDWIYKIISANKCFNNFTLVKEIKKLDTIDSINFLLELNCITDYYTSNNEMIKTVNTKIKDKKHESIEEALKKCYSKFTFIAHDYLYNIRGLNVCTTGRLDGCGLKNIYSFLKNNNIEIYNYFNFNLNQVLYYFKDYNLAIRKIRKQDITNDNKKYAKINVANKMEVMYFYSNNFNSNDIYIFEGIEDLLSLVQCRAQYNQSLPKTLVCLNSTQNVNKFLDDIKKEYNNYNKMNLHLFLDNDNAGNLAVDEIRKNGQDYFNEIVDERTKYKKYNDLNEFWVKFCEKKGWLK